MKSALLASAALALAASPAAADTTDLSFAVHDIIVTSNIPTVNISVRNMSASTDPAHRDLRMVSDDPVIAVTGQLWCKTFNTGQTAAERAQIMFGNANVAASQNGADILPIGPWGLSPVEAFSGTHALENFAINAVMDLPESWNGGLTLGAFNPVEYVESRLEHFVEQGAGSEADFLRVDDVFETSVTLNAVGWCSYDSPNISGEYAGLRAIPMTIAIFYHGDADIQDTIQTVGGADAVAAQQPNRARDRASTRGNGATPPARTSTPARTSRDRAGNDDERAGLLLPAVQNTRARQEDRTASRETGYRLENVVVSSNHDQPRRGGVSVGAGDINNDGRPARGLILPAVQSVRATESSQSDGRTITYTGLENRHAGIEPEEIDNRFVEDTSENPDCPTIGSVVRREATNALIGAVFGTRADERNRDRRSTRERLADDAIDRLTQC
ncbi:hypothetical protein [Hyphobacterium marinum]|uniref:Uncharacterized protein n=1 Tax=Hyphobacterium marinum TaxID=3116574 RepID=A0ABU7LX32_9PROT|nr:hypothetical protein [Hyphobacterium sp. Y6023]MEE2566103.1 hypothetical protein [Hyphobacterium sp. Y6023]